MGTLTWLFIDKVTVRTRKLERWVDRFERSVINGRLNSKFQKSIFSRKMDTVSDSLARVDKSKDIFNHGMKLSFIIKLELKLFTRH